MKIRTVFENARFVVPSVTITSLVMALCLTGPAHANRLHFTDGESITGSLVGIEEGKVQWKSTMMGTVSVEQHHVRYIDSGDHFDMKMTGREMTNCWMFVQRDQQHLHCDQGVEPLSSWTLVVAAAESLVERPPRVEPKGDIRLALEDSSGNTEITKYNLESRTELRYVDMRHTIALRYREESAAGDTTTNSWRASYQYDQFTSEQWFVTGNAFYEEDEFRELDSRGSVGLGMGYQFLETAYFDLLGKGTLNYVDEQFSTGESRTRPAFLWSLDFAWRLDGGGTEFFHRHAMLQSIEEGDDFEINTTTGFKYPINGNFSSVLQLEYDYDNLPGEDAVDKVDRKWSLGVNYDW